MTSATGNNPGCRLQAAGCSQGAGSLRLAPSSKGLTLVEVLISVALLGVGSVLGMQALLRIAYAQTVADQHAGVHLFALSKMADLELTWLGGQTPNARERGRFYLGRQLVEWELTTRSPDEDGRSADAALSIGWRSGGRRYERRFETALYTIKEKQ